HKLKEGDRGDGSHRGRDADEPAHVRLRGNSRDKHANQHRSHRTALHGSQRSPRRSGGSPDPSLARSSSRPLVGSRWHYPRRVEKSGRFPRLPRRVPPISGTGTTATNNPPSSTATSTTFLLPCPGEFDGPTTQAPNVCWTGALRRGRKYTRQGGH
ncbi:unnamed protein product, partial [Sphacelaria rigidula]